MCPSRLSIVSYIQYGVPCRVSYLNSTAYTNSVPFEFVKNLYLICEEAPLSSNINFFLLLFTNLIHLTIT